MERGGGAGPEGTFGVVGGHHGGCGQAAAEHVQGADVHPDSIAGR